MSSVVPLAYSGHALPSQPLADDRIAEVFVEGNNVPARRGECLSGGESDSSSGSGDEYLFQEAINSPVAGAAEAQENSHPIHRVAEAEPYRRCRRAA